MGLALARNVSQLQRAENAGWLDNWPETGLVDRKTETLATEIAVTALQQIFTRLGSSSTEIRQRFGSDTVAARPSVKIREAETMIAVGLLKSMKELQLVAGSEYLFEALKDTKAKGSSKKTKG